MLCENMDAADKTDESAELITAAETIKKKKLFSPKIISNF